MNTSFTKKLAFTCLGLACLAAHPALAAASAPANWGGGYAGVHFGGAFADFASDGGVAGPDGSASNILGGLQLGYNWQGGNFVYGVEGDITKVELESHNGTATFDEDYMATIRGRAGYAMGAYLPYVTIGLGLTDVISKSPGNGDTSDVRPGLALGAGVDMILANGWTGDWFKSDKWIGRLEYLNVDVPKENAVTSGGTTVRGGSNNNIVRAALNYKF
ncbi:MAG: outer membrane beta-barrel protein [Alphaproteobacteria bacterium]